MNCKIIPIKRLPKKIGHLDYSVPDYIENRLQPGQLVLVPFKQSQIHGIVLSVGNYQSKYKLKPVLKLLHEEPLLSNEHLTLLKKISDYYGIALGSAAKLMSPPLQKRKLLSAALLPIKTKPTLSNNEINYICYKTKQKHRELFEHLEKKSLIVVPTEYHLENLAHHLADITKKKPVIWHSKLSIKNKFDTWFQIRNDLFDYVIGTKASLLLPFVNLKKIIIDYEHDEAHKNWDQSPRYRAHQLAKMWQEVTGCAVTYASYSPSVTSYFHIHKNKWHTTSETKKLTQQPNKNPPQLIINAKQLSSKSIVAHQIVDALESSTADIFLLLNKRGYARTIICSSCKHKITCTTCSAGIIYHEDNATFHCHTCKTEHQIFSNCPKCKKGLINIFGIGVEKLKEEISNNLQPALPNHQLLLIDKEKEVPKLDTNKNYIIIGTQAALPHIRWSRTDHLVITDIDHQLSFPSYLTTEKVYHLIQQIQYFRKKESTFFVQTKLEEHPLVTTINAPTHFYATELSLRKKSSYPPYSKICRYLYPSDSIEDGEKAAKKMFKKIHKSLTIDEKLLTILDPLSSEPHKVRGKYWTIILVKMATFDLTAWYNTISEINALFDENWRIDPDPLHLLKP